MIKKKYLLLSALFATLTAGPAFAQESGTTSSASYASRDMTYRGQSYDVLDSNYVPRKRMEQHRKYLNHQYAFPAKPRNMWEVGVSGGAYNVSGDVQSLQVWNGGGWGVGAHVRKSLGYMASLRLDYTYGIGKGMNFSPSNGYLKNPAWNGTNTQGAAYNNGEPVFYNYRTEAHQLSGDIVFSLSNILFHRAKPKVDPYIFGGLGVNAHQTWINALDENYNKYDFQIILDKHSTPKGFELKEQKYVRRDLKDLLDDSYETDAESLAGQRSPRAFDTKTLSFTASLGFGFQFRLSNRVNLALEDRITFFPTGNEDLLDGQRWDEQTQALPNGSVVGVVSPNKDATNYLSLGLNFNLGNNKNHVEPLYWLNPLDHAYNELSAPRHMILPEPILPDADGDGIADQFDKCPGTPAGVAVDSHGCPMDTDGDGVPDDRDKQLITPTECQPVDADGVGKCPCNCEGQMVGAACGNISAGAILFGSGSAKITPSMEGQLATLAAQMQANPNCKVVVMGNPGASKVAQQRSWDRVNAVIEYLSEKSNIDRGRFIFQYDAGTAGENTVNYRSANPGEEGPSNVAPPHPDLRK